MFVDELIATIGQGFGPEAKHIWFMTWHQFCLFRQNASQEPNYYYLDICRVDQVSNHSIGPVVELCSSDELFLLSHLEWLRIQSTTQTPAKWGQGGHLHWCCCHPALKCPVSKCWPPEGAPVKVFPMAQHPGRKELSAPRGPHQTLLHLFIFSSPRVHLTASCSATPLPP